MTEQKQVIVQDDNQPVVVSNATTMLQAIGQLAMTPDMDIDKLERIMQMQVGLQERENEAAFNRVMATVQAQTETVRKNKKNTQTSSNYADLAAVIQMVKPVYSEAGMALSFDTEDTEDKAIVRVACLVSAEGFTRRYTYDSPLTDKGIGGKTMMTPAHARGSAISYGRRYLTCMIFNIDTSDDQDGNVATANNLQIATFHEVVAEGDAIGLYLIRQRVGDQVYTDLFNSGEKGNKTAFKAKVRPLESLGPKMLSNIELAIESQDDLLAIENLEGISHIGFAMLCKELQPDERNWLKAANTKRLNDNG